MKQIVFLCVLFSAPLAFGGPKTDYGRIELLRDTWGIPHVFSDTDEGAMYGLGFATAEDRGFQMTYNLRLVQGRLSEVTGEIPMLNRNETSVDHDRKMRTFGFSYFLKTATARIEDDSNADFCLAERNFIEQSLAAAWRSARQKYGPDVNTWNRQARRVVSQRTLGYFEGLDGFPSLDPEQDLLFPPLTVTDGGTIMSQAAQAYTQWVPMHDPDEALSVLPIGQSERPDSPFRNSTMDLWAEGRLHPAPLSRAKVEEFTISRQSLKPQRSEAATDESDGESDGDTTQRSFGNRID